MNILQVHNRYREPGGEDVVARKEAELLAGEHDVERWVRDNSEELKGLWSRLKLPFTTYYSRKSRNMAEEKLRGGNYDVMHVHNFFPLFTPSIFDAAELAGVPSVMTLHNYRLIHPGASLYHDGQIDERSVKGSAWSCVADGVYRGSVLQTAVVAQMIEHHRTRKTWHRVPTLFIALTEFARQKMAEGGLPEERIAVKPNFTEDPGPRPADQRIRRLETLIEQPQPPAGPFLYVGRISPEKGVEDLVDAWLSHGLEPVLRIAGDGPERNRLERKSAGHDRIKWLGRIDSGRVTEEMARATALLFPSRWYEGFPMTLVEAFSVGCPPIVTGIGSQAEIVGEEKTGLHVSPGNPGQIAEAVERLAASPEMNRQLSLNARKEFTSKYTPERNYRQLMEIYERAVRLKPES